ncbi:MAG: hypothetical protein ABI782_00175 [Anaerolineaceae bacterium]
MQTWFGLENWMWIAIEAAIVLAIAVAVIVSLKQRAGHRRTGRLHESFGPEYDRTVSEKGRGKAEDDLDTRTKRAESVDVRPLTLIEGNHYKEVWAAAQARFVDDPSDAVTRADRLVTEVLQARGYPTDDFDISANAVSVDHPRVVIDYRAAHEAAERNQRGAASTDDLRSAMTQYRAIFDELVDVSSTNGRQPVATP